MQKSAKLRKIHLSIFNISGDFKTKSPFSFYEKSVSISFDEFSGVYTHFEI